MAFSDNDPTGMGGEAAAAAEASGFGGGGGGESYGIGMFGPMGLRGYRRSGQQISFSHPSSWDRARQQAARESYYEGRVDPQSTMGKMLGAVFGKTLMPPTYTGKNVRDDVFAGMQYRNEKRGLVGRMGTTTPGTATGVASAMTPMGGPISAAVSSITDIVGNYYEDEASVRKELGGFYTQRQLDAAFRDYQQSRVEGLEGFGGGETSNEQGPLKIRDLLSRVETEGDEVEEPAPSPVEDMRLARRRRTQRIFAGALGRSDRNRVSRATLLGQ